MQKTAKHCNNRKTDCHRDRDHTYYYLFSVKFTMPLVPNVVPLLELSQLREFK